MWDQRGAPAPGSPVTVWAEAQGGLVTRSQSRAAGLGDEAITWKLRSARWVRKHPGVYLTAPGRDGWDVTAWAAFLRVQTGGGLADAALVGASAAHVQGLSTRPPAVIEIGVPTTRRVDAVPGIRIRRMHRFDEVLDDTAYPWRTAVAVTVLDVAASGDADAALAGVGHAVQRGRVTARGLAEELRARGRHPHGRLLAEVLADVDEGAHSAAEVRYVRDVERAHGLPAGTRQVAGLRGPRRVHDTVYEELGVVVEVDGRLGHEGWSDRVRDGRRDRASAGEGRFTTRVFWPDVAVTPCTTAVEVGEVLRARGWRGDPRRCRRRCCAVPTAPGVR